MPSRFGPYGEIQRLRAEVNRLIEALVADREPAGSSWHPAVDVLQTADADVVQVELPGAVAAELQVEIRGRLLTIRGCKGRLASEPAPGRYHLMERFIGSFAVAVEVPRAVNAAAATATLEQGVLTITLPHVEDRRQRTYTISIEERKTSDG